MPNVRWLDDPKEYHRQWYSENKSLCNARAKAWAKANPKKCVTATRKWRLGIGAEEQERILSEPCKICGEKATHIDHCHKTGAVRGGLCNNCNTGLGMFRDNHYLMLKAALYIRKVGK